MSEIFITQAVFGIAMALFEIPSAYLGDLWGRKNILLLGSFITGVGFTFLFLANGFWSLIFYEILLAIGASFVSGADLSVLYDSIDENNTELRVRSLGNMQSFKLIGEAIAGVLCSVVLYFSSYSTVVTIQVIVGWFPFILSFYLIEPPIERMKKDSHQENFKEIIRHIFKKDSLLSLIFFNTVVWSLSTFCAVWIIQKYWLTSGVEIYQLGILWGACNLIAAITGRLARRIELGFGIKHTMNFMCILPVVAYITMGLSQSMLAVLVVALFYVSRGINSVIMKDAYNSRLPSKFRNTANSLMSLVFRGTFFIIGPLIGFSIDNFGLDNTLLSLGLCFALCYLFMMLPLIYKIRLNK